MSSNLSQFPKQTVTLNFYMYRKIYFTEHQSLQIFWGAPAIFTIS